jgi:hypothetical protein
VAQYIEGIWTDTEDRYRLGIVRAPESSGADYVAVVLATHSTLWQPDEIQAEIRTTAAPDVFTCTYFMHNKKPVGTTLTMEHDAILRSPAVAVPDGQFSVTLMRVWPELSKEKATVGAAPAGAGVPSPSCQYR